MMKKLKMIRILALVFISICLSFNIAAGLESLRWDASTGNVVGYKIYYGAVSGYYDQNEDVGNVTTCSLDIMDMQFDTTYYYIVRAYNDEGESGDSNIVEYHMPLPVISPPIDLIYHEGLITWTTPEGNFDSYKLYYTIDGESGSMDIAKGENEVETPLLSCGSESQFYMVTIWRDIESTPTPVIDVITRSCPPTNLQIIMD